MLEEDFRRPVNKSKLFLFAGVSVLFLLLGIAILIWRMQEATSANSVSAYDSAYNYAGAEYGSCGGSSCGNSSSSGGSCCSGSGLGTENMTSEEIGNLLKEAEEAGLSYYMKEYGDNSVSAEATDFGCHIQVDIYRGDQIVKSLGYDAENGIYSID